MPAPDASASIDLSVVGDSASPRTLRLRGRLDKYTVETIWTRACQALPRSGDVRIDAAELEYLDGFGVALLHDLTQIQRRRGGSVSIHGLATDQQAFLDLAELDQDLQTPSPRPPERSFPQLVGLRTTELWHDARSLLTYLGSIVAGTATAALRPHRTPWSEVFERCTTAGAFALPVVSVIGFLLGWVMGFSAAFIMHDYGADTLLAALIGPAMVRELGPLMTSVVFAARSGSAFAAEIGTMKVNEEVDALTTMGLDPIRFLVVPKIIAGVLMTPLLAVFANVAGIVGGALVSRFVLDQPLVVYTNLLRDVLTPTDIALGMVKALVFGALVAGIGCIRGLQTAANPTAVGKSTTSAVVTGIVFIAIADAILAMVVQVLGI